MRAIPFSSAPRYLPAALIAVVLALPSWAQTEPAAAPTQILPAISVSLVGTMLLTDRVLASGLVAPVERVQVQPLIEGQPIEMLAAEVGDFVAAGQVLARLSSTTLELQRSQFNASLAAARATIAQAEAQLIEARSSADEAQRVSSRTTALKAQGNASQAAADQAASNAISATARVTVAIQSLAAAQAQLKLSEAQLANVDLQLSRTEVRAPVAGEVVDRNALIGNIATAAGLPMFVLIKNGALELNVDVAEVDMLRLAPGQAARMLAVGMTDPLTGTIRLVDPSIDTTSRLGRARINIDTSDKVLTGMFMEATIIVAAHEAVAVPVTAVGSSPEGVSVMRVAGGVVTRVPVKTGIRDGGWVEITEGLAAGDSVVTKAGAFVRDGDRINPVPVTPGTN